MSYQLAVNTCTSTAELALFKGTNAITRKIWEKAKSHSEVITKAFSDLLSDGNIDVNDIDQVYCVHGPGSFTGLRVGVNFAKTVAFSFDLPVVSINHLDFLAASVREPANNIVSVMDAQKNSVFLSNFVEENGTLKPHFQNLVVPIGDLGKVITTNVKVVGNGLELYKNFLAPEVIERIEYAEVNDRGLENIFNSPTSAEQRKPQKWFELQPLYIKASAPEEKLNPTTLKI